MTASLAAAEVSLSGRAGAGILSKDDKSSVWSGIDIGISASVTTDGGMTLSVSDDIGGGKLADYADKELDTQGGTVGQPTVTVSLGTTTVSFDEEDIDDLYDDSYHGDIGVSSSIGGMSVGLTYDTDAAPDTPEMSYSVSGALGAISVGVVGTDDNGAGKSAYEISASYELMPGASISASSDNVDGSDAVNEVGISYAMGDVSFSYSTDSEEDWDAGVTYATGNISVAYTNDKDDEYEIDASVDMGGGVSLNAATDHTETFIVGVGFTF